MAILSEVVDVVVFVEEGHADLANRKVAGEAVIIVLVVGRGQSVSQKKVLECFSWNFWHVNGLID